MGKSGPCNKVLNREEFNVRVCGISFDSRDAIIAIVDFLDDNSFQFVESKTKRIELGDHEDATYLKSFCRVVTALVKDNNVNRIAIRKCIYSGKYQSGAPSLKMEAVLQLAEVSTTLLASKSIAAICDKHGCEIPGAVKKYQTEAFRAAFAFAKSIQECS